MSFLQNTQVARNEPERFTRRVGRTLWRIGSVLLILTVVLLLILLAARHFTAIGRAVEPDWNWYMTDTHVHSSVSADAFADIGIHSDAAKAHGYDSIFITDHDGGSNFHINRMDANNMRFEDDYTRWELAAYGQLTSSVNQLASTPVNSGTRSLRLEATAGSNMYGETMIWTKRGPNFRSGDIILKFSVYPTRIDPGSGVYVSVSIGGDPTIVKNPTGYTTTQGVVSPGKSTVLVWQLGSPRSPSSDPQARVLTYDLGGYNLNRWNHFEINVSDYLDDIPSSHRPLDYNGLTHLKMAAAASSGTVRGYFDTWSITASDPVPAADEFVYRTSIVDDFNTSTFQAVPAAEMGQQKHANRLNFGITNPDQYTFQQFGADGIDDAQSAGYPVQLNHPGTTITVDEVIDTLGHGADFLEIRQDEWIDVWDQILNEGRQIIGTWSSDTHTGVASGRPATMIYAPARDTDTLLHSLFEGRSYNVRNNFEGDAVLNLDGSDAPYPARYPVLVSPGQSAVNVHLNVDGGMNSTHKVVWYRNGEVIHSDNVSGSSYDAVKSIPLNGERTNVRAEIRTSTGVIRAMTQSIMFVDVAELPTDRQVRVDRIVNPENRGYTVRDTHGITNSIWSPVDESLTLTLENLPGALVTMQINSPDSPERVRVDGNEINGGGSLEAFDSATDSTWYYNAGEGLLYLKARHATPTADVRVAFSDDQDQEPPGAPSNLGATVISGNRVDLSWDEATDNIGIAGYDVYRNDELLVSLGNVLSHSDTTAAPSTTYTYYVIARDGASNISPPSDPVTVTTTHEAIFSDGFELGDLSLWSNHAGIEVQTQDVFAGTYAARATGDGSAAYAWTQLPGTHNDLYYQLRFKLNDQGANSVYLMRYRTATGTSIMGMFVNSSGRLGYRNDIAGRSNTSTVVVSEDEWHELQVRVKIDNANGEIEVWYDGQHIDSLSRTEAFGSSSIGRVQIGDNANGRTFDLVLDNILVNSSFIGDGGGQGGDDNQPPTAPANLAANSGSGTEVNLTWDASTDNVGVVAYDVFRDGGLLTDAGNVTSFTDTSVTPETTYSYQVRARDSAGNVSEPSNEAVVTTPEAITGFIDSFETGDMSQWTTTNGIQVQNQEVYVGSFAARATNTGSATYAQKYLETGHSELHYQLRFKVIGQDNSNAYLLRYRTPTGGSLMGLYVNTSSRLGYRNDVSARSTVSSLVVTPGVWHTVQVRVNVAAGEIETWYDGVRVDALSKVENFGSNSIGRIQLGDNAAGRNFDIVFDEVIVDSGFIDVP